MALPSTTRPTIPLSAPGKRRMWRPDPEALDDPALVEMVIERSEAAFGEVVRRHGTRVHRVAFGLLRDAALAEDVTQDVFTRFWERPERFDPSRGKLEAFLGLDAHGRAIDLIRSEEARSRREETDQRLERSSNPVVPTEEEAMKRITSTEVRAALERLKPEERQPIVLAFFFGYSYRKVADVLGLPEGTVKSRIRSGMAKLKGRLAPELALVT